MNLPFDALPITEQRRAIARDVIAQITAGFLTPAQNAYLVIPGVSEPQSDTSLRQLYEAAKQAHQPCKVCALGGLFAAQITLNGDCQVADLKVARRYSGDLQVYLSVGDDSHTEPSGLFPYMLRYFDAVQLQTIEIAFEGGRGAYDVQDYLYESRIWDEIVAREHLVVTEAATLAAVAFTARHPTPSGRLLAIMDSIVSHPDALFVPDVTLPSIS